MVVRPSLLGKGAAAVGAAALALSTLATIPAYADPNDETITLDLLGINDFHGRIEEESRVPGALRLASAVERIRDENPDTLFLAAGDNFGGATFVTLINDENPAVAALNAMELDASSLGNHEFDQGFDVLRDRMDGAPGYTKIDYELLGANVSGADPDFEGNHIFTTESGVKVGVIGMVTPTVPTLVSPGGIEGLTFENMADTAREQVQEVEDAGADVVVITVHEGANDGDGVHNPASEFGELAQVAADLGVAAVFSGHTHVKYLEEVTGESGNTTYVLQTGSYTANLGRVTLTLDGDGEVLDAGADMIPLEEEPVADGNPVIEEIKIIIADAVTTAEELGSVVVGQIGADLNRAIKPDESENRGGESTIGNLIADIQLWAVSEVGGGVEADLAFMNPGGIRGDMLLAETPDGDVTFQEVATMQPFGNTLESFTMTGADIVSVLEQQWQPETSRRPYLKLGVSSRLSYTFDPEAPKGAHITSVFFDGEPLDEEATFTVLANNFLADGGDSFFSFADGTDNADTGMSDLEAFVNYFEMMGHDGTPVVPDYEQRSLGVHWNTDADAEYEEGEELSVDLSSVVFSTTEPRPEAFDITLESPDGTVVELEDAELLDEFIDLTDETGIAKIRATIPALDGLDGPDEWSLVIGDSANEVSYSLPIRVFAEAGSDPDDSDGDDQGADDQGSDDTEGDDGADGSDDADGEDPGHLEDTGINVAVLASLASVALIAGAGLLIAKKQGAQ